jgi:adenylylsulfate kinase
MNDPFAVWITGPPASGKSTLARAIRDELAGEGLRVVILESDELRKALTPQPRYDEPERHAFYASLLVLGQLLLRQGFPVIFDATANLRRYRDAARSAIPRFAEVYVDCPLPVREARDPKGLYSRAKAGEVSSLPGAGAAYEPPLRPEFVVHSDQEPVAAAARRVARALRAESVGGGGRSR